MRQVQHNPNQAYHQGPTSRALWFSLLSGPVFWSIHFLFVYLLVEISCQGGLFRATAFGMEWITVIVLGLTLAALLAVGYGTYFSYRNFQKAGGKDLFNRDNLSSSTAHFMAISGISLNLLFGLLIILMGIPAIVLSPCVK